ncbi:hypothetical protein TNCV_3590851 [Trichonephila clavipes]|nr:hypothetical protein TNCV_3590851 [Trichonephila clavipes]
MIVGSKGTMHRHRMRVVNPVQSVMVVGGNKCHQDDVDSDERRDQLNHEVCIYCSNACGRKYIVFLQRVFSDLLWRVPDTAHQNLWFLHDGATAHFSIALRNHLHSTYHSRWIGCGGSVAWGLRYRISFP